jgi:7-carboxy-7-deazaguanine synthase
MQYPIVEHFYTLQGEGYYAGKAAYFIRLAGCDIGCVWCDTKESWDAKKHPSFATSTIIDWAKQAHAKLVVITGGEPLMHDCTTLTESFINQHISCNVETSGAYASSGTWNWFCLSPKKFKLPLPENYALANELKIIIFNRADFDFAIQEAKKVNKNCKLYLQPEWSKKEIILPEIMAFIKANTAWQLSLQTHKYLGIL